MRIAIQSSLLLVIAVLQAPAQQLPPARITGRVTDASGAPLIAAKVYWNKAEGYIDSEKAIDTRTDADGRYELPIWFKKNEAVTIKEVFAESDGYVLGESPDNISLRSGDMAKLDFRVEKGEMLAGQIRLPRLATASDDSKMFLVSGPSLKTRTINARLRLTDADGKFRTYLPSGEYTLELLGYGGEAVKWTGIKTGQSNLLLELPPFEWSEAEIGHAFDDLGMAIDRNYSYFFLKPDVDWAALRKQFRPKAVRCKNADELTKVLQELLAPLRDPHVWIQTPTGIVPTHQSSFTYNGNPKVTLAQLVDRIECGRFAIVAQTKPDGFGYFLMAQQSAANPDNVKQAVEAIRKLRDSPGFIVDLRSASGGNELLAQEIAKLFCAKDTVYAKQKYRSGPGHDQFGPEQQRVLAASPDAYTKPVVCLIGPGAVSSGEGFVKMMKCLPQVTTVGMPTRGASGNPKPLVLSRTGLSVYFSRWVDLMPDGTTFEGKGIPPEVEVNRPSADYAQSDPTLEKGLELLRAKMNAAGR